MDSTKILRPYLEFNITNVCNLKCLGCSWDSPFCKNQHSDFANYQKDLEALSKNLLVKKFRIIGGEPLLSKQLMNYLIVAKASGMFESVGICTNGVLLSRQDDELFNHLDYIEVSSYPATSHLAIEAELLRRQKIHPHFQFEIRQVDRFMVVNLNYENNTDRTVEVYRQCNITHDWSCHTFKDGYFYKCFKPLIQDNFDKIRGIQRDYGCGGVAIHQPDFKQKLREYIDDPNPLDYCKSCLGTSGPLYEHQQMSDLQEGLQLT